MPVHVIEFQKKLIKELEEEIKELRRRLSVFNHIENKPTTINKPSVNPK